jgi:hypothetical protein
MYALIMSIEYFFKSKNCVLPHAELNLYHNPSPLAAFYIDRRGVQRARGVLG